MADPIDVSLVRNSDALVRHYGAWLSFHDALVVEMHLWRGHIYDGAWDDRNVMPMLTMAVRVLGARQDLACADSDDVIVTLRFHDVGHFRAEGFDNNNDVLALDIEVCPNRLGSHLPPSFKVTWLRGAGLDCSYTCWGIDVAEAVAVGSDTPMSQPRLFRR